MTLDKDRIKAALLERGMRLSDWARGRGIVYAALCRVLRDQASDEVTREIRAALAADGLCLEVPAGYTNAGDAVEAVPIPAGGPVFWSFSTASAYLGIPEKRIREWSEKQIDDFPRPLRLGKGGAVFLHRQAVQDWASNKLAQWYGQQNGAAPDAPTPGA